MTSRIDGMEAGYRIKAGSDSALPSYVDGKAAAVAKGVEIVVIERSVNIDDARVEMEVVANQSNP